MANIIQEKEKTGQENRFSLPELTGIDWGQIAAYTV